MQGIGVLPPDILTRIAHLRRRADLRVDFATGLGIRPFGALEHHWRRSWTFAGEAGADRWNAEWEAVLERPGSLHPALVQVRGRAIRDPLVDALARLSATVLCEEIRRGSPFPFMRPGGSYRLEIGYRIHPFPPPRFARSLLLAVHGDVFGAGCQPLWSSDAEREIPFELVPESVVSMWNERSWAPTDETYA